MNPSADQYTHAQFNQEVSHRAQWHTNCDTKPSVLVLTRQNLPCIHDDFITEKNLEFYKENKKNGYIISCGSELNLALLVGKRLKKTVISMPFFEKKEINACIHIIEASSGMCWNYLFNQANIFNIKSFGASGKCNDLLTYYGFTLENLLNWIAQTS